jgi:hypothetical protein
MKSKTIIYLLLIVGALALGLYNVGSNKPCEVAVYYSPSMHYAAWRQTDIQTSAEVKFLLTSEDSTSTIQLIQQEITASHITQRASFDHSWLIEIKTQWPRPNSFVGLNWGCSLILTDGQVSKLDGERLQKHLEGLLKKYSKRNGPRTKE